MKKTTWLPILLLALFAAGSVWALRSPSHRDQETPADQASCKVKTGQCPENKNGAEFLQESLSRQFLHISSLIY